jgi:RNA recognition motif-containing protein
MSTEDARKLFVAGLADSINEDVLRQLFEATGGTVVDVSVPRDRTTGRPRGFAFVTLGSSQEAEAARGQLDGSLQAGREISVRPFQAEPPRRGEGRGPGGPGGPREQAGDRTLYVGNLPYDVTQREIEELFSASGAGPIVRIHLPSDPEGRPRGFGFVTMGSSEAAQGALEALRDKDVRSRRLTVNIAYPRGERPPRPPHSGPPRSGGFGGPPPGRGFEPAATADQGRRTFDDRRRGDASRRRKKPGAEGGGERPEHDDARRPRSNKRKGWDDDDWDE